MKLPREFYTRTDVLEVARDLLGKKLVGRSRDGSRVAGIIVETEAYRGPEDRASHAYGVVTVPEVELPVLRVTLTVVFDLEET